VGNCSGKYPMNNPRRIVLSAMNQMPDFPKLDILSQRERDVTVLAAKGLANKAIARELNVTEGTVKLHLHSVYRKLGINSRFALAVWVGKLPAQLTSSRNGAFRSKVK